MLYIVSKNHKPRLAMFTEVAGHTEIVKGDFGPLDDFKITEVPVSHEWHLEMFGMPRTAHEEACIRHDRMRGFATVPAEIITEDYSAAMADLEFAMSHLREGMPNGQTMRVRTAMKALMRGAFTMLKYLTKQEVMK